MSRKRAGEGVSSHALVLKLLAKARWLPTNIAGSAARLMMSNGEIRDITRFEQKHYSQNGEDGILKAIFKKIGTTNKFCVEFGVQDGNECNTRHLIERGWKYLHMDCGENLPADIKNEKVTAENINSLFRRYKVPAEFDLLSIDIDSNDYWVWKSIKGYSPRVVVIEYNASVPPTQSKTIEYDPNFSWDGTDYYGASLLALERLGRKKGYTLVGCERRGVNAFFIRDDLVKGNFEAKSAQQAYRRPRYGKKERGEFIGHPPSKRRMITV